MAALSHLSGDPSHPPCDLCDWIPAEAGPVCASTEPSRVVAHAPTVETCLQRLHDMAITLSEGALATQGLPDDIKPGPYSPSPSRVDLVARTDMLPELVRILSSICHPSQPLGEEEHLACEPHYEEPYPSYEPKARLSEESVCHFRCHRCQRTVTPKRRRGPDGTKTLCNVCGLVYAKRRQRRMLLQVNAERKLAESKAAQGRREDIFSRHQLLEGIASCFNSPLYADLTIYIGEVELPAHSLVLASQSAYFNTLLNKEYVEGFAKPIYLNTDKPHAYWRVFQYMYCGNYSEDPCPASTPDDDYFTKDLQVYLLANILQMESLKESALERFRAKIEKIGTAEALEHTNEIMSRVANKSF